MNDAQEKFEKRFQESHEQYIKNLPGKVSEIKLLWNQLNVSKWRARVILKIKNMEHNLAGSGGTFGFYKLSEKAKLFQEHELQTIQYYQTIPTLLTKIDLIYILYSDKDSSLEISQQLLYFGCSVKIITDISTLTSDLRKYSQMKATASAYFTKPKNNERNQTTIA